MGRVQKVSAQFKKALSGKTPPEYLSHVFLGFEARYTSRHDNATTEAKDYIMQEELIFSKILKCLENYHGMVLNIAGVGEDWRQVEEVKLEVRRVIRWLDNLLCDAMVDPQDLVVRYHARELDFQH